MSNSDFLDIDPDLLDEALLEQPRLAKRWLTKLAQAQFELDEAETSLKLMEAKLATRIRAAPENFGLSKVTDQAIKETIPLQAKYQRAVAAVNQAKHNVGVLKAMQTALDHRKRSLEKLVDLHGQHYFASPRVNDETMKEQVERKRRTGRKRIST